MWGHSSAQEPCAHPTLCLLFSVHHTHTQTSSTSHHIHTVSKSQGAMAAAHTRTQHAHHTNTSEQGSTSRVDAFVLFLGRQLEEF